jgi:triosephosphate isomerase (TIM)
VTSSGRRPLMAGNWKMNLNHLEAIALVQKLAFTLAPQELAAVEVVVLPPFTSIRSVQTVIDGDHLELGFGAQDLSPYASGAYTGDVSGSMLAKLGCQYVIVGHSERRTHHHEGDDVVAAKLAAAVHNGLRPILCVGESLEIRQAGTYVEHCLAQLQRALDGVSAEHARTVVIAYEPVWAIGTGEVATPEDAQEVCAAIRTAVADSYSGDLADQTRILYGGSVKAGNVGGIMAQPDIDGALVGGASIDAGEFAAICRFHRTSVDAP